MNRILRLRDGSSINTIGLVALGLLVLALGIAGFTLWPVYTMYKSPPTLANSARATSQAADKFHNSMARNVEMVDGRSWFFEPKPPEAVVDKPPVPKQYGGPQLVAFINGTAWFADGQKVSLKEPKGKTVELVRSNAPWSITVRWSGGEFDVDLFKRVDVLSLKDGSGYSSPYSGPSSAYGAHSGDSTIRTLNGRLQDRGGIPPGPGVATTPPQPSTTETVVVPLPVPTPTETPVQGTPALAPPVAPPPPAPGSSPTPPATDPSKEPAPQPVPPATPPSSSHSTSPAPQTDPSRPSTP